MCTDCKGTCPEANSAPAGPPPLRFLRPVGSPARRIVGSAGGAPSMAPTALVSQPSPGVATYEDLFTGLAPNGEPALYVSGGTFPAQARPAGRYR